MILAYFVVAISSTRRGTNTSTAYSVLRLRLELRSKSRVFTLEDRKIPLEQEVF